jgi:hypothetical protein
VIVSPVRRYKSSYVYERTVPSASLMAVRFPEGPSVKPYDWILTPEPGCVVVRSVRRLSES